MHDLDAGDALGVLNHAGGFWLYLVLFLLILIQECGVPFPVLPSEVVLLGGGFLASQNKIALLVAGLLATSATLIGNSALFLVGRHFGRSALDRYGKYIHLRPDRVDRIEAWVSRSGTPLLLYGPLVPILRAYVPALAGIFGVPFRFYITILVFAAVVWSFGLLLIGMLLGNHYLLAVHFLRNNVRVAVIVAGIALVSTALFVRWRRGAAIRDTIRWPERLPEPAPITKKLHLQRPSGD
jgi:membrane protein DedA with SNARE-associated domain